MSKADKLYDELVKDIIAHGYWDKDQDVRPVWKDGLSAYTKSVIGRSLRFDNAEVPILTKKEVKWLSAVKECLIWIWQMKSNKVQDLRDLGSNIWNEWEINNPQSKWHGTIGAAYGYQLAKQSKKVKKEKVDYSLLDPRQEVKEDEDYIYLNQVDYLIHELKNNPASRRHITMLWDWDEIDEMSLTPCVYETQWHVKDGKLHLEVRSRSNDIGIGHPFNVFQYNVLQRVIAQVVGLELGEYIYHMGDAHVYDRHIEPLTEQMTLPEYDAPTLWINPEIKNFYDFTINDIRLENYNHGPFIKMPVAI